MEIVIQGTYYDLIVGDSIWGEWKDKRVFQILNKEFNVVEAEGPNELRLNCRTFIDSSSRRRRADLRSRVRHAEAAVLVPCVQQGR